ncbi:16S rRNA (cytosine(1402)-N(4))-methyltransferase RsmH [Actinophytocola algeriensis]|uniref:Ribosomal RNA small subunit methyltransferase H n=1 Tax=Actinophytocola algeriensis TaxID=1768010 RepID=A0A7W7QB23_9PSEU|nr:16S rRNA (cytosine(1402)-N(4))-methyltransferase RsmH [Actinophytocola algeriensis]MBB4910352.1 16S rRNA (cytosine1402-N4)-methyltransferase [Actinophytocola algeriensis]MBE1480659.1 16S rRNA (cytosine1402-N4)-methyltransferase [Actinophytocola algeriensis]
MGENPAHVPVLLERVLALFEPALTQPGAVLVDTTLGLGGHSDALLAAHPALTLVGLDRDPNALDRSRDRLARYGDRVHLVHAVYDELPDVLSGLGIAPRGGVAGVLMDLGVSSMQLDVAERGFAYSRDAPLDMRMDPTAELTAAEVLNTYPPGDLVRILRDYGEERFAKRIVDRVVRARATTPFTNSGRLVELLYEAVPAASRRTGGHPAKRTFQALRIEVNGELAALRAAVPAALRALRVGGRIVVESYQSLEDRIVKHALAELAKSRTPEGVPVELPGHGPQLKLLTRGAEQANEQEIEHNPRAASVRLRAAERILEAA